jgi:hypothetical protein
MDAAEVRGGRGRCRGAASRSSEAAGRAHQANKSSPMGPAEQLAGGSFCKSMSSFWIRLLDDIGSVGGALSSLPDSAKSEQWRGVARGLCQPGEGVDTWYCVHWQRAVEGFPPPAAVLSPGDEP